MKGWLPYLAIALGVGLIVYALLFAKTEEEKVRVRLDALEASLAMTDDGDGRRVRETKLRRSFSELFAKDVSLAFPELGATTKGRGALADFAIETQRPLSECSVDLDELSIRLDEEKEHALAVGTARVDAQSEDGTKMHDERTVSLRFDLVDREWRIVSVAVSLPKGVLEESAEGVAPLRKPSAP